MIFKKILSQAIDHNVKIIITGKSGWGKSEMICQVAEEKGMELIDFRLSEVLPEDLVGIPKVINDYYEYVPPKWLYEVITHPEKKYLLFLDEITQGTPEVLNICYKIFDKVTKVGDHELLNVSVVGATNYSTESNYLSDLPTPLKKRACMLELNHSEAEAASYLMDKYKFTDKTISDTIRSVIQASNPRSTDNAIRLILEDCSKDLIIPFIGYQQYQQLSSLLKAAKKPEGISNVDKALTEIQQGFTLYVGERCRLSEPQILKYKYDLSDEEFELVKDNWKLVAISRDTTNNFFTLWALNHPEYKNDDLMALESMNSFNALHYLYKMSLTPDVLTNQFETLKVLLRKDTKELLRLLCEHRTLPLNVMIIYRADLPWNLLKTQASQGYLTERKMKEFAKELQ